MNPLRSARYRLHRWGRTRPHWVRSVMDEEVETYLRALKPARLTAIEISGTTTAGMGWRSYTNTEYPEFDLLDPPAGYGTFDVVVCQQVLEHVTDPWTAVRALAGLAAPGGHVIVTTPFLLPIHGAPSDYWRFTPDALRLLLESASLDVVRQGQWGNRSCLRGNLDHWAPYMPWHQFKWFQRNEPLLPQVVWAFARRSEAVA